VPESIKYPNSVAEGTAVLCRKLKEILSLRQMTIQYVAAMSIIQISKVVQFAHQPGQPFAHLSSGEVKIGDFIC